jgi:hypothetical protein
MRYKTDITLPYAPNHNGSNTTKGYYDTCLVCKTPLTLDKLYINIIRDPPERNDFYWVGRACSEACINFYIFRNL